MSRPDVRRPWRKWVRLTKPFGAAVRSQRDLGARLEIDESHRDLLVTATNDERLRFDGHAARQLEIDFHALPDGERCVTVQREPAGGDVLAAGPLPPGERVDQHRSCQWHAGVSPSVRAWCRILKVRPNNGLRGGHIRRELHTSYQGAVRLQTREVHCPSGAERPGNGYRSVHDVHSMSCRHKCAVTAAQLPMRHRDGRAGRTPCVSALG